MKKLLFQTDSSLAKTGFGRNAKALLSYLYRTKKYEIVQYCCGTDYANPVLETTPWKSIGTLPSDPAERQRIGQDPGQARIASYGGYLIDKVMKEEEPDFYFGVQDIWGTEFAVEKPWFDKINSVIWTTLDSLPILPTAIANASKIKNYWIWSSFATKALNEMGHKHIQTVHGCIESKHFFRLPDEERVKLRKQNNIEEDAFIIGFVFRNQLRKSVPNLLEGYAKWKKENKPKEKTYLLLHTYWKEGWGIHKIAAEYGISPEEILTTHVCRKCRRYQVKKYSGEEQDCSLCGNEKAQVTTNVGFGVRESQLNEIYNFMDVYCHPFTSGGQEIPIQEAKLTELITLVTDYSCGEENCEEGSESIPLEWSEYREHQTEFKKASTHPASIAKEINSVYEMDNTEKQERGKGARKWALDNFSVEVIGKFFEDFIDNAPETNYDFEKEESKKGDKRNYPDAVVPHIESDSEWVLTLYKKILNTDNHTNDDGYKTWMKQLEHKVPRAQIEDYFRKVARDHNQKFFPVKMEDLLDEDDKGKRMAYVMPESAVDVFLSTSLLKSLKLKYPEYNLYFVTKPQYYHILDGNEYIHKVIPYNSQFDNVTHLEGIASHEGFFEIAFTPYLTTQRANNYAHNDKDRINKETLCMF
jgi:glycosyltransferase involved in cell wall biosynthesis